MRLALAWLLLVLVCLENQVLVAQIPRRWGWRGIALAVLMTLSVPAFLGFALAKFGIQLLGGAS